MRTHVAPSFAIVLLCWSILMLINACGGIDPDAIRPFTGLRGTIRYIGGKNAWPKDSIYDLRVVAFEKKPKVREDVVSAVVQQTAAFSPVMLPTFEDSTLYVLEVLGTPRTFEYVVVAMQNGPCFLTDWLMLDVYAPSGDPSEPGRIVVPSGGTIDLDFRVDFNNLPPQPFP